MARTPKQISDDLKLLEAQEQTVDQQIGGLQSEAKAAMDDELLALLKLLVAQAPNSGVIVRKLRRSKKWIFQVEFQAKDVATLPDVSKSMGTVGQYAKAATLPLPVGEEE